LTGIICLAEGAVFDASQYAFFGKEAVQEVELGGLEDDGCLPIVESNEEEFFFNREEVNYLIFNLLSFYDDDFLFLISNFGYNIFGYKHVELMLLVQQLFTDTVLKFHIN